MIDFSIETAVKLPSRSAVCTALKPVFSFAPNRGQLDYWAKTGICVNRETTERVKLETLRSGGEIYTSLEAARRFLRACNAEAACVICNQTATVELERISDGKKLSVCPKCQKEAVQWTVGDRPVYRQVRLYVENENDA